MKNFLKKIWEAIKRLIASIPEDKAWHFVVNFALAMSGFISYWLAVGLCVGASLGKEYGDSKAPAITGAGGTCWLTSSARLADLSSCGPQGPLSDIEGGE